MDADKMKTGADLQQGSPAQHYTGGGADGFGFSAALICLKNGDAVARHGWNAGGQFVVMMPRLYLPPFNTQDTSRKVNDRTAKWIGEDQPLDCQPYFALYNAQKKWQPGWVPSTSDLLAEDWYVIPAATRQ